MAPKFLQNLSTPALKRGKSRSELFQSRNFLPLLRKHYICSKFKLHVVFLPQTSYLYVHIYFIGQASKKLKNDLKLEFTLAEEKNKIWASLHKRKLKLIFRNPFYCLHGVWKPITR